LTHINAAARRLPSTTEQRPALMRGLDERYSCYASSGEFETPAGFYEALRRDYANASPPASPSIIDKGDVVYVTYTDDDGSLNKETFYRTEAACQQAIKPVNERLDEIKRKNLDKYR
jgi:hypothetical protein